jgi:transcription elongation factor B subunit 1
MDIPIPSMQGVVRQAAASRRAQASMDPVKLIASDGSEIIIDRRAAMVSGTIKSMLAGPGALSERAAFLHRACPPPREYHTLMCTCACASPRIAGQFAESQQGEIKFPEISAKVLEKTVQYFYHKLKYTNHQGPMPEFKIEPEQALELLMAANFLDT